MSLQSALTLVLEEYGSAQNQEFSGNSVANFLRNDVPNIIQGVIGSNDRYTIHGSPGQGNWANVPWFAVYDRFITESAQDGYYVVYLDLPPEKLTPGLGCLDDC